jgi:hypothetical protein
MYQQLFMSDQRSRYRFNYRENVTTAVEPDSPNEVSIYPNPTSGKLAVGTQLTNYTVHIYNLNGNLLNNYAVAHELDISNQPAGIYILSIESPGLRYRKKIIKY